MRDTTGYEYGTVGIDAGTRLTATVLVRGTVLWHTVSVCHTATLYDLDTLD